VYASTVDASLSELMRFYENPAGIVVFPGMTNPSVQEATKRLDRRYRAHIKDLEGQIGYYGATAGMGDPAALFKEALAIDPNDRTAQFHIREIALAQAEYYLRAGRVARAVRVLTEAIHYAPKQTELYATLGDIYHQQLEQDEEALACYESYVKLGGRSERVADLCRLIRASLNKNATSAE